MRHLTAHSRLLNHNVYLSHLLHQSRLTVDQLTSVRLTLTLLGPGHVISYQSEGEVWYCY